MASSHSSSELGVEQPLASQSAPLKNACHSGGAAGDGGGSGSGGGSGARSGGNGGGEGGGRLHLQAHPKLLVLSHVPASLAVLK